MNLQVVIVMVALALTRNAIAHVVRIRFFGIAPIRFLPFLAVQVVTASRTTTLAAHCYRPKVSTAHRGKCKKIEYIFASKVWVAINN
jgi:hypothetical protein